MDEIAAECIRTIAQAKELAPETITLETTLESLALDSLDRVTLSFDLEEHYRVEIPEHVLLAMTTVGDVVAAVHGAIAKQNRPSAAATGTGGA